MEDLIKIIKWRDEIKEVEYTISRLILAEQMAVDEENYEKAQLMLMERGRLIRRKKYLTTKITNEKQ
tara:strand:- start:754 stop:954 length:201 start_codon:yes stop_codon:yes gene_type:complete